MARRNIARRARSRRLADGARRQDAPGVGAPALGALGRLRLPGAGWREHLKLRAAVTALVLEYRHLHHPPYHNTHRSALAPQPAVRRSGLPIRPPSNKGSDEFAPLPCGKLRLTLYCVLDAPNLQTRQNQPRPSVERPLSPNPCIHTPSILVLQRDRPRASSLQSAVETYRHAWTPPGRACGPH